MAAVLTGRERLGVVAPAGCQGPSRDAQAGPAPSPPPPARTSWTLCFPLRSATWLTSWRPRLHSFSRRKRHSCLGQTLFCSS